MNCDCEFYIVVPEDLSTAKTCWSQKSKGNAHSLLTCAVKLVR